MPLALPFVSGAHLSIDVPWPVLLLRGAAADISHVLGGEVLLMLNRPIVASSISIKLVGKSSTVWPEGNIQFHIYFDSFICLGQLKQYMFFFL
jgi:hypothetical protein